jgi:hypothetical protein
MSWASNHTTPTTSFSKCPESKQDEVLVILASTTPNPQAEGGCWKNGILER